MNSPATKCTSCGRLVEGAPLYAATGEVVCAACEASAKDRQIQGASDRDRRSKQAIVFAAVGAVVLIVVLVGLFTLKACVSTSGPL
ncbi:MAG: hypothetical protein U0414_22340 [Polyangiaceae bacterium]